VTEPLNTAIALEQIKGDIKVILEKVYTSAREQGQLAEAVKDGFKTANVRLDTEVAKTDREHQAIYDYVDRKVAAHADDPAPHPLTLAARLGTLEAVLSTSRGVLLALGLGGPIISGVAVGLVLHFAHA
jgi:hypothetical protein